MIRPKVVVISTHPVAYHVDFYKILGQGKDIEFSVVFFDKPGNSGRNEFPVNLEGADAVNHLYDGYTNITLTNYSIWPGRFFWRFLCPGVFYNASILRSDVIILFGYANITLFLTAIYSYLLGKRLIFRGEASIQKSGFFREKLKRIFLPRLFNLFDSVLYSFPKNREYFEYYGVPKERLFFAPSSVDSTRWASGGAEANYYPELRSKINKNKSFVYLFCGLLGARKDPFSLVNAFRSVLEQDSNAMLLVAGDGPLLNDLERWVNKYKLRSRIIFLGSLSEDKLREVYALADTLVLPSVYDPSPKVLHECFACGVPAIVADSIGTVGSFAIHDRNSLVYPAGDVSELTAAMTLIKDDKALFRRLKKNTKLASGHWSKDQTARGFVDAINHTLRIRSD